MGCGTKCIKWLVFVFNFIFFLTGCAMAGLGIWLNVERNDWKDISDFNYISVANVAIAAGVVIIIVAFLGCCGACMEQKCMLCTFFMFLLIIFLMEIGAGVCAYVWRGKVETELLVQINARVPHRYYTETGITKAVDTIQKQFSCCGVLGADDYNTTATNNYVPASCCKSAVSACTAKASFTLSQLSQADYNWDTGCYTAIKKFIMDNLLYVGITGVVFAVVQIMGMILSLVLYCNVKKNSQVS